MTDKISREVAVMEFDRFVECMDLDLNPSEMDVEDKRDYAQQRDKIVDAISRGSVTVNDNGEPTFTPRRTADAPPITFYEPTGASLMAMDRKKKTEDIGKLYASMADMSKTHSNTFAKMKMSDLKICMAIATLFLA